MKLILQLSFFFLVFSLILTAQPYAIGHTTITFNDPLRDNRAILTEIYYPADVAGDNVLITTTNADKFPVLVFGHGFVMGYDAYEFLWQSLVPHGFIMAFPTTEGGLFPSHSNFGADLAFVISSINGLDLNDTSLFFNRVSEMNAVMGHSMGGGAAFLAAANSTEIKTLVTFASAETNPSAISAAAELEIPALIFAGANDCVTPPSTNQIPMYQNLIGECKTYISINGGSHCQMADSNFLCGIGEATCSPSPEITREDQHLAILKYLTDWLKAQLTSNCIAGTYFDENIAIDPGISFEKTCLQCEPLAVNQNPEKIFSLTATPNPFSDAVSFNTIDDEAKMLTIFDVNSRKLFESSFEHKVSFDGNNLTSGIYIYMVTGTNGLIARGKLVKK